MGKGGSMIADVYASSRRGGIDIDIVHSRARA
jgi:hypothetical protein